MLLNRVTFFFYKFRCNFVPVTVASQIGKHFDEKRWKYLQMTIT